MNAGQLHALARLLREIATLATADPGEAPVPGGVLAIVEDIAHHEGTSVGEIASRTGLAQSLVSTTVGAMRDRGILETTSDPNDRRRALIRVEPRARGELFHSRAVRPIDSAIRYVRPSAPEAEIERVIELLDELGQLLNNRDDRGERKRGV